MFEKLPREVTVINDHALTKVAHSKMFNYAYLNHAKSAEKMVRPAEHNVARLHVQQTQGVFLRGQQVRPVHAAAHGGL